MPKRFATRALPRLRSVLPPRSSHVIALTVVPLGTVLVAASFWALTRAVLDTSHRLFDN